MSDVVNGHFLQFFSIFYVKNFFKFLTVPSLKKMNWFQVPSVEDFTSLKSSMERAENSCFIFS
jgi:hypothetical protein